MHTCKGRKKATYIALGGKHAVDCHLVAEAYPDAKVTAVECEPDKVASLHRMQQSGKLNSRITIHAGYLDAFLANFNAPIDTLFMDFMHTLCNPSTAVCVQALKLRHIPKAGLNIAFTFQFAREVREKMSACFSQQEKDYITKKVQFTPFMNHKARLHATGILLQRWLPAGMTLQFTNARVYAGSEKGDGNGKTPMGVIFGIITRGSKTVKSFDFNHAEIEETFHDIHGSDWLFEETQAPDVLKVAALLQSGYKLPEISQTMCIPVKQLVTIIKSSSILSAI